MTDVAEPQVLLYSNVVEYLAYSEFSQLIPNVEDYNLWLGRKEEHDKEEKIEGKIIL